MSRNYAEKISLPTREVIARAAGILRSGGLVSFPTETVYGLGANALDPEAVEKIYRAKGRPSDNPLILHVPGMREAARYAEINSAAELLMRHFWPGPLTIVLYSLGAVPAVTRANLDTVAMRAPMNWTALELIREAGVPIAAPSANKSGRPSPTTAQAVCDDIGDSVDMIIDGGHAAIGIESTVIDATEGTVTILRPGGVTREMLEQIVDVEESGEREIKHRSPGTRHRHYAPSIPLFLWDGDGTDVFRAEGGVKWCYMGLRIPPDGSVRSVRFDSLDEYGRNLFAVMRELETCGAELIIADLPGAAGLGEAIRNRLTRASAADDAR
ncbi:MAG: threonylcarbamoyl-AMP synthase [Synergistaceae bacterium]|jgi:L-threonylcarbamoyladenylate synthase|nr:threonylcarbamoyl-AMP synthase [Synergistaceae bacterium]